MPREPDLSPKFYASRDRWALDIAGQFARDGKRRKEFFRTEQEAKTRALEIKNSLDRKGKVHRDATPELIRSAVHFHELFQFYGFSGLEEACEYVESRLSEERRSPTLRSLVEAYLLDYKKASTADDWKWLEGKLQAGLWDQRVATMDADFWRDELDSTARRHKWAPRTYNLALMWLKSLFRHACANGKVPRNPVEAIRSMDLPARHVAVFEPEQLRELLANCFRLGHPEMALHFAVLCFAGLRPEAEFVREGGVRWEDVLMVARIASGAGHEDRGEDRSLEPLRDPQPNLALVVRCVSEGYPDRFAPGPINRSGTGGPRSASGRTGRQS